MDKCLFFLGETLKCSLVEKELCFKNKQSIKNAKCLTSSKLIELIENEEEMYFHEYILEDKELYVKLFLDIDIKEKIEISDPIIELNKLTSLIVEKVKEFTNEYVNIGDVTFIGENITFTTTTKPDTFSYHVFFNNIIMKYPVFLDFKKKIKQLNNENTSMLTKYIDLNLFRKNLQLRFIYSKKEDSPYIHIPLNIELSEINLYKFSIFNFNPSDNILTFEDIKIINTFDSPIIKKETPYYIKYLQKNQITKLFPKLQSNIEFISGINKPYYDINDKFEFNIGYCEGCKRQHKNKHYLAFEEFHIVIKKYGNLESTCPNKKRKLYPLIEPLNICKYLIDIDYIRAVSSDQFIGWKDNQWEILTDEKQVSNYIYNSDVDIKREDLTNMLNCPKKLCDFIPKIIEKNKYMEITTNPYLIRFNNGYYDLKNNIFLPNSIENKNLLKLNKINIDYRDYNELDNNELKEYDKYNNILEDLLDKIMFCHKNEDNSKIFKANLSSILYTGHKGVITFFVGKTNAGKSTIKLLLEVLFEGVFLHIPMISYVKHRDPNKPDPALGNVTNMLLSFSSEKDKDSTFLCENIKQLTELKLMSRKLFSNNINQINTLSQFIDLNVVPKYDDSADDALRKRIAIIMFKSFFARENDKDKDAKAEGRELFIQNPEIEHMIKDKKFNLPFIHLLMKWFKEYHSISLSICTSENSPMFGYIEETLFEDFLISKTECPINKKLNYIKPDKQCYYILKRVDINRRIIKGDSNYIKEELLKMYKEEKDVDTFDFIKFLDKTIVKNYTPRVLTKDIMGL